MSNEDSDSERPKKQSTLLTKLRRRFMLREEQDQEQGDLPEMKSRGTSKGKHFARHGNTNALRSKRKIQIGLKVSGKHIRKEATGGGKREVSMRKSLGRAAIIERSKEFFFSEGNRFGPVEDFTFNLENFEEKKIDGRLSIGEMYESTGLPLLRFYLCAIPKEDDDPLTNSTNPDAVGSAPTTSQATLKSQAGSTSKPHTATTAAVSQSGLAGSMTEKVTTENVSTGLLSAGTCAAGSPATVFKLSPGISVQDFLKDPNLYEFKVESSAETLNAGFVKSDTPVSSTASADACSPSFVDLGTPTVQARKDLCGSVLPGDNIKPVDLSDEPLPIVNDLFNYVDDQGHPIASDATAANYSEPRGDSNTPVQKVKLHRGHVLKELTEFYKENDVNATVEVQMIMPNGQQEAAEDSGGVLRDALSEYWEAFYLMNTTGENEKVPFSRDNMKKGDWQASAKVLVMGYKQEGYFPYKLAQLFLQFTMEGDDTIDRKHPSLLPAFLENVPDSERELLECAMQNFNEVDQESLLDVLETYKVQRHVRDDNIKDILEDAAHRTLIQASSYICRCWHPLFVNKLRPILRANLADICKQALPTTKRVTDAIILPNPATEAERNTGKLLLKYIRSLSSEKLAAFMRYTTGANLMLGQKITVRFVEQTYFERRPVAHTCGCMLELATSFKDYIEFRSEFNAVLDAKIWVMDIV